MPDWVWVVIFIGAYVVLTQWLLPKLGVPTWRSGACVGSRRENVQTQGAASPQNHDDHRAG